MIIRQSAIKRSKSQYPIFIAYILAIFISEIFYRGPLFQETLKFVEYIQKDVPDPRQNTMFKTAEIISLLGAGPSLILIILITYNYANIYKTLVMVNILLVSQLLTGMLKMIYMSPRPYWEKENIIALGCEGGWGNPSGHSLTSTAFYLTVWHIVFDSSYLRNRKVEKALSLAFTVIFILLIMISRVITANHSFNQIIFGSLIGFGLYFFTFNVLCVRVNDSNQCLKIIDITYTLFAIINVVLLLIGFLLFLFNVNDKSEIYANIFKPDGKCPLPANRTMQTEGFSSLAMFLANMGAFTGVKFEYDYTFKKNTQSWRQYNFELEEKPDDESLMTKISINRETQWNHTNSFFSCMRLFVICVLSLISMAPYLLVSWNAHVSLVLLIKIFLPMAFVWFGFFFTFKIIAKMLRLTNITMNSMSMDSI